MATSFYLLQATLMQPHQDDNAKINRIAEYLKQGLVNTNQDNHSIEESNAAMDDDDGHSVTHTRVTVSTADKLPRCETNESSVVQEFMIPDPVTGHNRAPRLLEFLRLLLRKPHYRSYASYIDEQAGIFEIHRPNEVAALWERVKIRQSASPMDYDKFARAIRWYYPKGHMIKTNTRHTFRFGSTEDELDEFDMEDES